MAPALLRALLVLTVALAAVATGSARADTLAGGDRTSCSVTGAGAVFCWGAYNSGGLGVGPRTAHSYDPLPVTGLDAGVTDITAGDSRGCAIQSGAAKCWGNGQSGQLGNGTSGTAAISWTPVPVTGLESNVTKISMTSGHACAVQAGAAKCWGPDNGLGGSLGYSDSESKGQTTPVQVAGMTSGVTDAAAGRRHSCVIQTGVVSCFGDNTQGELGYGGSYGPPSYNVTYRYTPKPVRGLPAGRTAVRVVTGADVTCAILDDGSVWCWGANSAGQLGMGATTPNESADPVKVSGLDSGVTDISLTGGHACVIQAGAAKCWGSNQYGQLGDGMTRTASATPVAVTGLGSGVTAIAAGNAHSCATASGRLYCWGHNGNGAGQLGNEEAGGLSAVPVPVIGSKPAPAPVPAAPKPVPTVTPKPAATIDVPRGTRKLDKQRRATVATLRCPAGTTPCAVTVPKTVKVTIARKTYTATVLAGTRIAAGKALAVRVRLTAAAGKKLRGRTATVSVKLSITAPAGTLSRTVKTKIKR